MGTTERIERLESAQRALTAQHLALQTLCQVLLPLIPCSVDKKRALIRCAGAMAEQEMLRNAADTEFREMVSDWMKILNGTFSAGIEP